jgi:hypothetical protein
MKNLAYIALILLGVSCTKFDEKIYDRIPENEFPENEGQAALRVIPTYKALGNLIDDGGWWFWAQEVTSDEVVFPVRNTDWDDGGKWRVLHQHEWDNNTDAVNTMWSSLYGGIFEANKAIDELLPYAAEPSAQSTLSKLKTLRALYFYLLIDNYGDVPYVTSFFDAPAQPFKENKKVIWEGIVKDLQESIEYLPVNTNKFAVSKGMAFMLLAKLHLNAVTYTGTSEWKMAENYCDSIIDLGVYSLESNPLGPFVAANENSPENIFTIPFDEFDLKGFRLHMRTLHYVSDKTFDMTVGPWNGFAVVEDHYKTYENNDLRKTGFLVGQQYSSTGAELIDEGAAGAKLVLNPYIPAVVLTASNTPEEIRMSGARVAKYEIEKGIGENLNNDFPIFRYADVLLMKAECVIRQGGNGDSYVQQIRSRAKASSWSGVTLDMLLEERGREMFCEGHRRQDLIRFDKFTNAWWGKPASSADRKLFPIPQWAIDANPNLAK